MKEIAEALGRTVGTVYKFRADLGLVPDIESCEFCRGEMPPRAPAGRRPTLCSDECRSLLQWAYEENARIDNKPHLCEHCDAPLGTTDRSVRFCQRACSERAWWERARENPETIKARRATRLRAAARARASSTSVQKVMQVPHQ